MSILRKGNIPPREVVDKDLFFGNLFSLFLCIQGPKQYETKRSTLRYSFILFSTRQGFLLFPFLRVPHSFRNKKIWTIKLNYRKVEPRAAGPIFFLGNFRKLSADVICCEGTACLWLAADGSRIRSLVALNRVREGVLEPRTIFQLGGSTTN